MTSVEGRPATVRVGDVVMFRTEFLDEIGGLIPADLHDAIGTVIALNRWNVARVTWWASPKTDVADAESILRAENLERIWIAVTE